MIRNTRASGALWLAKGTPREWLKEGEKIAVRHAPTRWGRIDYRIQSKIDSGIVEAKIFLSDNGVGNPIVLRLRVPEGNRLKRVEVNGKPWNRFDPDRETVTLPDNPRGRMEVKAFYR